MEQKMVAWVAPPHDPAEQHKMNCGSQVWGERQDDGGQVLCEDSSDGSSAEPCHPSCGGTSRRRRDWILALKRFGPACRRTATRGRCGSLAPLRQICRRWRTGWRVVRGGTGRG